MKTRCVAGAAYKASDIRSTLTHTVTEINGTEVALCKRVKSENLLDDSFATDEDAAPTCPHCLKKDTRFAK
jgi:hypothetical protein